MSTPNESKRLTDKQAEELARQAIEKHPSKIRSNCILKAIMVLRRNGMGIEDSRSLANQVYDQVYPQEA